MKLNEYSARDTQYHGDHDNFSENLPDSNYIFSFIKLKIT